MSALKSSAIIVSFVFLFYCLQSEGNVIGEWEFQNIHPDLKNLYWEQLDNLTSADLARICSQIEKAMPPTHSREYYYENEKDASYRAMNATVLKDCQVTFRHDQVPMTLIECDSKRLTFYLAEGDENHVFVLRSNDDNTYTFTGTKENVTYFTS